MYVSMYVYVYMTYRWIATMAVKWEEGCRKGRLPTVMESIVSGRNFCFSQRRVVAACVRTKLHTGIQSPSPVVSGNWCRTEKSGQTQGQWVKIGNWTEAV